METIILPHQIEETQGVITKWHLAEQANQRMNDLLDKHVLMNAFKLSKTATPWYVRESKKEQWLLREWKWSADFWWNGSKHYCDSHTFLVNKGLMKTPNYLRLSQVSNFMEKLQRQIKSHPSGIIILDDKESCYMRVARDAKSTNFQKYGLIVAQYVAQGSEKFFEAVLNEDVKDRVGLLCAAKKWVLSEDGKMYERVI